MGDMPGDLKYSKSHEWLRANDDGSVTIGITDHAQEQLGDLVYVEVPENGRELELEEACAVVESVKAASDVYAPIAGEVISGNAALADAPELVNSDPYGDGWIMRIKPGSLDDVEQLMNADDYAAHIEDEDH